MAESKLWKMERAFNPASKRAAKEIREVGPAVVHCHMQSSLSVALLGVTPA